MKRFLAVLLSLILAAGSLFVAAFAADGKKKKFIRSFSCRDIAVHSSLIRTPVKKPGVLTLTRSRSTF